MNGQCWFTSAENKLYDALLLNLFVNRSGYDAIGLVAAACATCMQLT